MARRASASSSTVTGSVAGSPGTARCIARDRLATHTPLPDWAISAITNRTFHTFAGKVIVLTELFIAIGLWSRATCYAAVWLAVVFHASIEVTSSVQVFSYLGIAALVIWAVPSTR